MSDKYTNIVKLDKFTHVLFFVDRVKYEVSQEDVIKWLKSTCDNSEEATEEFLGERS